MKPIHPFLFIAVLVILLAVIGIFLGYTNQKETFDLQASLNPRPCTVYNTMMTNECDSGDFDKSTGELYSLGKNNIVQEKARIGAGLKCKYNMYGWSEMGTFGGNNVPVKSAVDPSVKNLGAPANWAFCYQDTSLQSPNLIANFGNRGGVSAEPTTVQFPGDSANYARITFNSLQPADIVGAYCSSSAVKETPVMNTPLVFIGIGAGSMKVYSYNPSTNRMTIYTNPDSVRLYKLLFDLAVVDTSLVYYPISVTATLYKMTIDDCPDGKRPTAVSTTTFPNFSLAMFGITPTTLVNASSTSDDLYGDIDTLNNNISKLTTQISQNNASIASLQSASTGTPVAYYPGMQRKRYNIQSSTRGGPWGVALALSATDLDSTFKTAQFLSQDFTTMPYFGSGPEQMVGITLNGYLLIKTAGTYSFKINADDAGEVFVNGQAVSTYYGYHPASDQAVNTPIKLQAGYVPYRVRFTQWGGAEVLTVYWIPPNANSWVIIPPEVHFHDNIQDGVSTDTLIQNLRTTNTSLTSRIQTINNTINT